MLPWVARSYDEPMLNQPSVVGALALLCVAVAGCSNPCVETCTAQLDCEGADTSIDCEQVCAEQQTSAEDSGCTNEYDNLIDCVAGADDVCALTEDTCKEERDAQLVCLVEYCINFPGEAVCDN